MDIEYASKSLEKSLKDQRALTGNFEGCWGIDLSKNIRLVIRPVGEFDPDDLTTITSVCIVDIQDYH